ncbi:MAG: four helix bundle protein [Saprospiraceae bacterium]|nr:four helix bundle protein [Saprospiraceae bacterium]
MRTYYFEKLDVWHKGRHLVKEVYLITKDFPSEEKFGMAQQLRRASISIPTNLAEGTSRKSGKDQARFTEIAYGSLMEVLSLLITALDLGFLTENQIDSLRPPIEEIGNKLNALRETQLKRNSTT